MNFEINNNVAILHFDDDKANVVSHDFIDAMYEGLDRAEAEAKAVVIHGREGKFSAGFDLSVFKQGPEAAGKLVNRGGEMLLRVMRHPQPVVAACTGHAIAAGSFLLLAADIRIGMDGNFKIGANETAIGMTLPTFIQEMLEYRVPKHLLEVAVLQAKMFNPVEATSAGFLDEVVTADELMPRALEMAELLGGFSNSAYVGNKLAIRKAVTARIEASLKPTA